MSINKDIRKEANSLYKDAGLLIVKEMVQKQRENYKDYEDHSAYLKFVQQHPDSGKFYQSWYLRASRLVNAIAVERWDEFTELYKLKKRPAKALDVTSYTISDYFMGLRSMKPKPRSYNDYEEAFDSFGVFHQKLTIQRDIVHSCISMLDSRLRDIEGMLQFEIFESELQAAKELINKKYHRAAGALAGVTLEVHLAKVCKNHKITLRSKNPTISKFNESLKTAEIIDVPTWRLIQRLGDIRNLAVHSKEREPTRDEVEDLIRGCEKLIAELN